MMPTVQVVFPRHVLCVLGQGLDLDLVARIAGETPGVEFDPAGAASAADPRMEREFRAAAADGTFGDADVDAVERHDTVAYLLSEPVRRAAAGDVAARMLGLVAKLFTAGATAVKNESSGITHGRARWLELAGLAAGGNPDRRIVALYRAWVRRPVRTGPDMSSCGLHLLGVPDIEMAGGTADDVPTMDAFAGYLLLGRPALYSGDTFRAAPGAKRWTVEHGADVRHPDDFFHNPFGIWRLSPYRA
ncbi:DUF4261 domain-containing protein [Dactylosporangium sp. AC04546]|uniref:DUF4261 domain-containing protein n=1 Tax=Dactylosporangium sp. AC04546 TaxID=2862460 RepID=UPI001EDF308F|nr:DUF4261 domain-containing protein [Dactylosporangium sp. AC04546]WVK87542.1 DUF4261 domain-containing protein [Dactylosporangium sp. AC04546]